MRGYPLSLTIDGNRLLRERLNGRYVVKRDNNDGALMELRGCNRWQPAKTVAVGCGQLPLAQPSTSCIT